MNTISSLSANSDNKVAYVNKITGRSFPTSDELQYHKHSLDSDNPAVYCGTYGKYNNGSLQGMWIDLTTFVDYDEFIEFCYNLHADEEDPELMFQDYENFPRELYSESCFYEDTFDTIIEYANHSNREAIDAFLSCYGIDEIDKFDSVYMGEFDSEEDFARHIVDECYDIERTMGNLSYYFDYEAFARDLFMCDSTTSIVVTFSKDKSSRKFSKIGSRLDADFAILFLNCVVCNTFASGECVNCPVFCVINGTIITHLTLLCDS